VKREEDGTALGSALHLAGEKAGAAAIAVSRAVT